MADKARARLGALALALAGFAVVGSVVVVAMVGVANDTDTTMSLIATSSLLIGSLAMYACTRARNLSSRLVLDLGLVFEVLLAAELAAVLLYATWVGEGRLAYHGWHVAVIVAFPLVIPTHPMMNLVASTLAALTAPAALAVFSLAGIIPTTPADYAIVGVNPLLAALLAYLLARVVFQLNREVARARQLGSYQLERKLGEGGMGEVWVARHRMLARPAAVKLVKPPVLSSDSERALARFEREAQVTATLTSPHTVELYDYGCAEDGTCFYVMELLDGLDLEVMVRHHGPMSPGRVVHVLQQVCDSLADAHYRELVHRDIKPANIQLCRRGRRRDEVKVLDFGLVALRSEADTRLTREGAVGGTPAYVSPEVARGRPADARSDLYALGCVAYWLLTGRTVFEAPDAMSMMLAHVNDTPVPPSQLSETPIPPALEAIVLDLLRKDPADRPQSAEELAKRLGEVPLDEPWTQERAREWWDRHQPRTAAQPIAS